ncbi:MAG: xanthine dehydrogenase accessory protein XdhC [Hyphomicrobiaceae bacterium]|nr:MAG: xanthine dehydrogenase accessory protein XdhC [Hyphomicrobiaceae bacterium]
MTGWLSQLSTILSGGSRAVRIVVAEAEGSTPREAGAAMIVTRGTTHGSIGGGRLEHEAVAAARKLLLASQGSWQRELRHVPLGPALGQCCGGRVTILLEPYGPAEAETVVAAAAMSSAAIVARPTAGGTAFLAIADRKQRPDLPLPALRAVRDMLSGVRPPQATLIRLPKGMAPWLLEPARRPRARLFLYGAGHVGRAVVRALEPLPFDITWIDADRSRFPASAPPGVEAIADTSPARLAAEAPAGAFHLVMTFSHPLDLDICHAILRRGTFSYLGLIGSVTKAMRFRKRLRESGIPPTDINRLVCPIGLAGVPGKEPAMIAAGVAADLLMRVSAATELASGGRETGGQ